MKLSYEEPTIEVINFRAIELLARDEDRQRRIVSTVQEDDDNFDGGVDLESSIFG